LPPSRWDVLGAARAEPLLRLAARDAARYVRLLRCGAGAASAACVRLLEGADADAALAALDANVTVLVALRDDVPAAARAAAWGAGAGGATAAASLGAALDGLEGDAHIVHSQRVGGATLTVCAGATPRATLYAVYALLEALGARFSLSGDMLPPPDAALAPPTRPLRATPQFAQRGLQPFHDFPMGPDWWSRDFYKALATNMAKRKFPF
jgi:hypothetical protein